MTARRMSSAATDDRPAVGYQGFALVELPPGRSERVDVELVGGRDRWSVGGQIAEGPRWWRGRLAGGQEVIELHAGAHISLALDNGRTAPAIIERATSEPGIFIQGLGPPPFEVP
jgi:hypothetical protein